jgi:hypothetical protein
VTNTGGTAASGGALAGAKSGGSTTTGGSVASGGSTTTTSSGGAVVGTGGSSGGAGSGGTVASGGAGGSLPTGPLDSIEASPVTKKVKVSENGRFLMDDSGKPFYWVGDTAWWLLTKLNREDITMYMEDRGKKGFNVIQFMIVRELGDKNKYGDSAFVGGDLAKPAITEGSDPSDPQQYDYWDHVDYVVETASKNGLYAGILPFWGSVVGSAGGEKGKTYAKWLADHFKNKANVLWINGGDTDPTKNQETWNSMGSSLRAADPSRLITYHPVGKTRSSTVYHQQEWLDMNMFQSGHRDYEQDPGGFGPDNFKYAELDYKMEPPKPFLDGEPSYENIPHHLHLDRSPLYWGDSDVRRYAYWSVFAGACGFTYGENSVMVGYEGAGDNNRYDAKFGWREGIKAAGSGQMIHLKKLLYSRPYFERVPDQSLISGTNGTKYDYLIATRGTTYAFIYAYTGRTMTIEMGKISGTSVKASWYDPRPGEQQEIGVKENQGTQTFDPPGEPKDGNDWVLILDSM